MLMLLSMAWRNVWRNRRRSIITILAVMFAVLLTVVMRCVQLGTYERSIVFSLRSFIGWVQLQPKGWQDAPTLQKTLPWDDAVAARMRAVPGVSGVAPRIAADGLICFRNESLGCVAYGLDPDAEDEVTILRSRVKQGRFLDAADRASVVLGCTLLENLGASVGDTLVLLSQGYDGSLGNIKVRVRGVVRTGSPEMDEYSMFVPLATLQEMLGMEGRVNFMALAVPSVRAIPASLASIRERIDTARAVALPWNDVLPELYQMIELDSASGVMFLVLLVVVVAFGILNTVLMSVTERFREFGMLLAIGTPQILLVLTVLVETMIITVVGIAAGNLLGWGIVSYMAMHPIMLGGDFAYMYEAFGFAPEVWTIVERGPFVYTTILVTGVSLLACVWPMLKVWRLEALGGIRFT